MKKHAVALSRHYEEDRNVYLSHVLQYKKYLDRKIAECVKNRLPLPSPFCAVDFPDFPALDEWIGRVGGFIDVQTFRDASEKASRWPN